MRMDRYFDVPQPILPGDIFQCSSDRDRHVCACRSDKYLLAVVATSEVALINMRTGNRWQEPIEQTAPNDGITKDTFVEMIGNSLLSDWTRISSLDGETR